MKRVEDKKAALAAAKQATPTGSSSAPVAKKVVQNSTWANACKTSKSCSTHRQVEGSPERQGSQLAEQAKPDTPGRYLKQCPRCRRPKAMSKDDAHQCCLSCLGPDHDMVSCQTCHAMPFRRRVERCRRLSWWKANDNGEGEVPTSAQIRQLTGNVNMTPHCLTMTYIKPRLGIVPSAAQSKPVQDTGDNLSH